MPPVNDPNMVKALRALYNTSPIAKALFDDFAARQKDYTESTVARLLSIIRDAGVTAERNELIAFLKGLDKIGCCRFITGRRGAESRVNWLIGIMSLGKCATGLEVTLESSSSQDGSGSAETQQTDANTLMAVHFPLRPLNQIIATIQIPRNLSQPEAQRLADFIKTLPVS